jgi:hypothetical protein
MKLISAIPLIAALFWALTACSMNPRISERSDLDSCQTKVEENAFIPNVQPAKVLKELRIGYNRCLTEYGFKMRAKELACDSGYQLVSLVNIQRSSFLYGPCYRAHVEFYPTSQGAQISEKPIIHYDTVPPTGIEIAAHMNMGGVMGGPQENSGLISEKGKKASTTKIGFHLGLGYYFLPFLGIEAETGGLFGSAAAPDTKSMDFTNSWSSNLGLSLIPWQRMMLNGRLQTVVSGGMNYTRLAMAKEYRDFVEKNTTLIFYDDAASGLGWYAGGGIKFLQKNGVMSQVGFRYSQEYPKFPRGAEAFSGSNLMLDLGFGYRFRM